MDYLSNRPLVLLVYLWNKLLQDVKRTQEKLVNHKLLCKWFTSFSSLALQISLYNVYVEWEDVHIIVNYLSQWKPKRLITFVNAFVRSCTSSPQFWEQGEAALFYMYDMVSHPRLNFISVSGRYQEFRLGWWISTCCVARDFVKLLFLYIWTGGSCHSNSCPCYSKRCNRDFHYHNYCE